MFLKKHLLWLTIGPLLLFMIIVSYVRFVVLTDYLVSYEAICDPQAQSCYVGCDNEDCSENYYYAIITRHANEIEALCGKDISDCSAADTCSADEEQCAVEYCDPAETFQSCDDINPKNDL